MTADQTIQLFKDLFVFDRIIYDIKGEMVAIKGLALPLRAEKSMIKFKDLPSYWRGSHTIDGVTIDGIPVFIVIA